MSRDGWLPPGVTDADIDRAAPGTEHLVERRCPQCGIDVKEFADELERLRADNKLLVERVLELELELNRGCRSEV